LLCEKWNDAHEIAANLEELAALGSHNFVHLYALRKDGTWHALLYTGGNPRYF
jgi:hypothetical protein